MRRAFTKKPADVLDYDFDFSRWLPHEDRIVAATAAVINGSVVITGCEHAEHTVKLWVSGGENGDEAEISVTIETDMGRVKQVNVEFKIKENC